MSNPDYVYGIFESTATTGQILEDLHKAGFKSADLSVVGKDCPEFHNLSAKIKTPMARYFVRYGIAGAIGGLWAGVTMAPQLPYPGFFQIITTVMATVSGGIVLAYWGTWMGAFLHANEPQYYANVFEGEVENGEVVVLVEVNSKAERRTAWEIMDDHNALEIITRQADLGQIIGLEKVTSDVETEENRPQLVAVA
jgi:hypothetical protein